MPEKCCKTTSTNLKITAMEPNNIEKQIRKKLNSREIQPSSQAWDRLDAMLTIAEEKKTKRSFGWLYIAATFLVFASVGMYFFNQDGTKINTIETVVANENSKNTVKQNTNTVLENGVQNTIPSSETKSSNQTINPTPSFATNNHKSLKNHSNQKTTVNPNINREKEIVFQNNSDVALKNLPKIETAKEIEFSNPAKENQNTLVVAEERSPRLNNISKVKVNANSLLSEVDGELDLTFREKVFKTVNKNYKEVKVALANRNLN